MDVTKEKSKYSVKFDSSCLHWEFDKFKNRYFLAYAANYFNDVLRYRKYVFLRDIYEYFGIPITEESIVVGWWYNEKNPDGDDYIDFCIDENEEGPEFTLDFNVDGSILHHFK